MWMVARSDAGRVKERIADCTIGMNKNSASDNLIDVPSAIVKPRRTESLFPGAPLGEVLHRKMRKTRIKKNIVTAMSEKTSREYLSTGGNINSTPTQAPAVHSPKNRLAIHQDRIKTARPQRKLA